MPRSLAGTRGLSLRAYLILLTLATLLPLAVFAAMVGVALAERERDTFRRGAQDRSFALAAAVDAELRSSVARLEVVAASPLLDGNDLRLFRQLGARTLAIQPDWADLNLVAPNGQQLVNMRLPPDAALSVAADPQGVRQAVETQLPVVGDMSIGSVANEWGIAVRVPVVRDGAVRFVVSAVLKPQVIARVVVGAIHIPPDATAVVVDGRGTVVATTGNRETVVGQPAPAGLKEALQARSGWTRRRAYEGKDVYISYARSQMTGWAFAVHYPAAAVNEGGRSAALLLGFGLLCAIAVALALATIIGRRIAHPIASLAAATEAMGRGERLPPPRGVLVRELRTLARALRLASDAVRERADLADREKHALQASDRAKDEFLAMLSHELRNPLAALTTAAHVLKVASAGNEAAGHARGVIERQTKHMARLIEDLLDISRISMGKAPLEREPLNLAELAYNVAAAWRLSGRFERHAVSVHAEPVWVHADRARIEQILSNLLDNALKFTPEGQAVAVHVRQDGGEAVLQVTDEGQGMSADMLRSAFELFVQGDHGVDRGKGGMGVGLALVRKLVEMHGGQVSAVSEGPGTGSMFTVRLPAVAAPEAPPAAVAIGQVSGPRRVVLIEDNDDARRMLQAVLSLHGHEVHQARDGVSGLTLVAQTAPDIVLIDIGLPDITGYDVARRIRETEKLSPHSRHMALVALTGYGQADDRRRALAAGFDVHLTKPVDAERIEDLIQSQALAPTRRA